MGLYINPKSDTDSRSKRQTILQLAERQISVDEFVVHEPGADDLFGVILADNGFIAAGIAFDRAEAQAFARAYGSNAEYTLLSRAQIAELDPGVAEVLNRYY